MNHTVSVKAIPVCVIVFVVVGFWVLGYGCTRQQQETEEILPALVDDAGILSDDERAALGALLNSYTKETTHQFAVEIISALDGQNIEEYSIERASTRRLGVKGRDNGLLFLVVVDERQMRIEVGYGLEAVLPDSFCGSVIRDTVAPQFAEREYYEGIRMGLEMLMAKAKSEEL